MNFLFYVLFYLLVPLMVLFGYFLKGVLLDFKIQEFRLKKKMINNKNVGGFWMFDAGGVSDFLLKGDFSVKPILVIVIIIFLVVVFFKALLSARG